MKNPEQSEDQEKSQENGAALPTAEEPSLEHFRNQYLRSLAENENMKKRLEKEKEEQVRYALFHFAKELIVIADNLERALASSSSHPIAQLYQGIEITNQEIIRIFKQFGIQKIPALGQLFDPHYHQVMLEKEDDTHPPQSIIEVLQEGYKLHDRLLRPALVVLSKRTETTVG